MRRYRLTLLLCTTAALLTTAAVQPSAHAGATTTQVPVCKHAPSGRVRCMAIRLDRYTNGRVRHADTPLGFTPADLQAAYDLRGSSTATIAIVDAYDAPTAERDLAVYRAQFHLPDCTSSDGCFRKVDQRGGASYPTADPGWAQEVSLDLDMASAACPTCRLLLVEASTPSQANLGAAVDTAARLGADTISNSYGGADASDRSYGHYYHHPGIAITASSGDSGYGVSYPASSKWVTAVGGTTLRRSSRSSRGWSETAWAGSGSGCSTHNAAPSWQPPSTTACSGRAVADIAAVADPATGVAVFDSYPYAGTSGWLTFGGTSAAAPLLAGAFALAGNNAEVADGSYVWRHHVGHVHDITSGSTGDCPTSRWCTSRRGWDGPTGWGSLDGLGAV